MPVEVPKAPWDHDGKITARIGDKRKLSVFQAGGRWWRRKWRQTQSMLIGTSPDTPIIGRGKVLRSGIKRWTQWM